MTHLDYAREWAAWEAYEAEAANAGSGATREQMTGASMMLGWLARRHRCAPDGHLHVWLTEKHQKRVIIGWDEDGPLIDDQSTVGPTKCMACGVEKP